MIERFLAYSRDHHKPIRLLILPDQPGRRPVYKNVIAESWNCEELVYYTNTRSGKPQKPRILAMEMILSADYARGDDGDPLQFALEEQNGHCQ